MKNCFCIFVFVITASAFSQNVQIGGTVVDDSTGTAVQGAVVSLADTELKDTTDENGKFLLLEEAVEVPLPGSSHSAAAAIREGFLHIDLTAGMPVSFFIRSLDGRTVCRFSRALGNGKHRIALPKAGRGVYLYHLAAGNRTYKGKLINLHGPRLRGSLLTKADGKGASLLPKYSAAAAAGKLNITHIDYDASSLSLDSMRVSDLLIKLKLNALNRQRITTRLALEEFYTSAGGTDNIPDALPKILEEVLLAEDEISAGDFAAARERVDLILSTYPKIDNTWGQLATWRRYQSPEHIGEPPGYTHLLMLDEITSIAPGNSFPERTRIIMTVVMPIASYEIPPNRGYPAGETVTSEPDPAILKDDYRILRYSCNLFQQYLWAISDGELDVELRFYESPDTLYYIIDTDTSVIRSSYSRPINLTPPEVQDSTDIWWLLQPTPPDDPAIEGVTVISHNGMGSRKGAGVFIANDIDLLQRSYIAVRLFFPRWLQHEFFHHLYNIYPEEHLEDTGHQWFLPDHAGWPEDFDFPPSREQDYYFESLHKRLRGSTPSLADRLKAAPHWQ